MWGGGFTQSHRDTRFTKKKRKMNENAIGKIIVDTAIEIHKNLGVLAREFKIDYDYEHPP